jgi:hypothetical protein
MKIRTGDAARKLGLTVPEFLDAAAGLMAELHEAWPEVDDGYVETMQQLYGLAAEDREDEETEAPPVRRAGPPAVSQVDYAKLRILDKLERHDRWGGNSVSLDTLRNHYCQGVKGFDEALEKLIDDGLVLVVEKGSKRRGPFSLNPAKKGVIQKELARVRS